MRKGGISSFPLLDDDTGEVLAVITRHIARQIFDALNQENEGQVRATCWTGAEGARGDVRGCSTSLPPYGWPAADLMRDGLWARLDLRTTSRNIATTSFGLFTERGMWHWPLLESRHADVEQGRALSRGKSKSTMRTIHDAEDVVRVRPESITAVERATPVRDCLSLMLGNDLLYAPVTENKKPIDVVSLRDINLYLAPTDGQT